MFARLRSAFVHIVSALFARPAGVAVAFEAVFAADTVAVREARVTQTIVALIAMFP